jgi:4-hydroxyphenylpyruvate dioxygenase/4-hydroxymandelate synthase
MRVTDLSKVYEKALACGARSVRPPTVVPRGNGTATATVAAISPVGDVIHTLIEAPGALAAGDLEGYLLMGLQPRSQPDFVSSLDHIALCLEQGTLDAIVDFYIQAFGFEEIHREIVQTYRSGMNSKVVQGANGRIKLPLQEPLAGTREGGQVQKFLDRNEGPGVQHLAFHTDDILFTLKALREGGVSFLPTPAKYYESLQERVGRVEEELAALQANGVLVDRDAFGYLLQIFSRSMHSRGTLFFEVIQRREARGFGGANVRALFESVDRAG